MKIYHYNSITKEYTNTMTATLDPLEYEKNGIIKYLIPANATDIEPIEFGGSNETIIFEGNQWNVVSDFRGTKYWLPDGTEIIIENINEILPVDALLSKPIEEIDIDEEKIQGKIIQIRGNKEILLRQQAIQELIDEEQLPVDFKD